MHDDASTPPESTLGAALAAAREQRGLSIEDVAAATRLRAQLIRQIERDDFSSCGGGVYARGHLKNVATVVGADVDALLAQFDQQHTGDRYAQGQLAKRDKDLVRFRPRYGWPAIALAVFVAVAGFLAINAMFGTDKSGNSKTSQAAVNEPQEPSASPTSDQPSPSKPPKPPAPTGVALQIKAATARAWVGVTSENGSPLFQGILEAGEVKEFKAPNHLTVRFGNVQAVSLMLNGKEVGAPNCPRSVCTAEFNSQGIVS